MRQPMASITSTSSDANLWLSFIAHAIEQSRMLVEHPHTRGCPCSQPSSVTVSLTHSMTETFLVLSTKSCPACGAQSTSCLTVPMTLSLTSASDTPTLGGRIKQ